MVKPELGKDDWKDFKDLKVLKDLCRILFNWPSCGGSENTGQNNNNNNNLL